MYYVLLFILGSVLASFYGVLATRLPEGKSIVSPRSHCDFCENNLAWYELIPIFSFLFLKGKCRNCKRKLPLYEPIVEFVTGALFSLSYFYYGFSYSFFVSLFLISLLIIIYISDFQYMIILDSPLIISSTSIFVLKVYYYGWDKGLDGIFSGIVIFLFFLFVGFIGKKMFQREALGGGDIKLSFVMGLTLGIPHAFMALALSTFLAMPYATFCLFRSSEREVPYGPFLVSALCMVFLFYDKFSYILNLFYI